MDAPRWQRIDELFHVALDQPRERRGAMLRAACDGDESLRAEVESLLAAHETPSSVFDSPAFDAAPRRASQHLGGVVLGQRIGRYTLRGVLGYGGSGVVYEAEQESPRRIVALKVMRTLPLADELTPQLFNREAQALARLEHPGIAVIHEAGKSDGWYFFAMERVHGVPLTNFSENHGLNTRQKAELLARVCDAVEYAHQKGVIHRDLKPANILVSVGPGGGPAQAAGARTPLFATPKIVDFGVARVTESDIQATTLLTDAGRLAGTIPYMSPEQVSGDPRNLDTRTDVYSLGVIAYELFAGRLPHDLSGKSIPDALRIIREAEPASPARLNRALRGDVETIILRAIEKDPVRRYQSAGALADDLRRFLGDEPIRARHATTVYQMGKLVSRHRTAFVFTLLLLFAILASAVVNGSLAVRFAAQRDEAERARKLESDARNSAERVTAFLEQLFSNADPASGPDKEPTLRAVLESGEKKLRDELADQPLVRARLAAVMGSVHASLGDYDRARELLEWSLETRRGAAGNDHPDTADALIRLARLLTQRGERERAAAANREALDILRRRFGETHERVAEAWNGLGATHFYAGDFARAAECFQAALDQARALHGSEHAAVAAALCDLGMALHGAKRLDEAEFTLQEARRIAQSLHDDAGVEAALNNLAHVAFGRGDPHGAEALLAEEVALARRIYRANHPRLAWLLGQLAVVVQISGRAADAEPLMCEMLEIQRTVLGDDHPVLADGLNQLGVLLFSDLRRHSEAEAALRESLSIRTRVLGPNSEPTAWASHSLAACLRGIGRVAVPEAEELSRHAVETLRAAHGEGDPRLAQPLFVWAQSLGDLGRGEEAEGILTAAAASFAGRDAFAAASALNLLGSLKLYQADFAHAECFYRQALATPVLDDTQYTIHVQCNLADALLARGELDEADRTAEAALDAARRSPNGVFGAARAVKAAGHVALERGEFALARRDLEESAALLAECGDDTQWADALWGLGAALAGLGDDRQAEQMLLDSLRLSESAAPGLPEWAVRRIRGELDECRARLANR